MTTRIDRAFLRIGVGQIHYRRAGPARPGNSLALLMAHGGPGSSAGLVPLIADLADDRLVVAPDMMGNGVSDPPPGQETSISFYAECLTEVLDALGLETIDIYGHHTGAQSHASWRSAAPSVCGASFSTASDFFRPASAPNS